MNARWVILTAVTLGSWVSESAFAADVPSFERDVRPILSRFCFKCHGPDEQQRQAELRLDLREAAIAPAESGRTAVVPGKPQASELLRRISLPDADDAHMPPASTKFELTTEQKDILRRWIAAGAEYRPHWAFIAPRSPPLPKVRDVRWPRNEIDHFVLARLESEGLSPSPPADRHTLARRVFLDLIGLPPTPAEADEIVNDSSPDAYEKLVDRLLASPHYGERWARRWLDLARYADTNGYEKDRQRSVWPYRDWVIRAINADMPFDQFTIEQLAGDMLPNATADQRVATGFHRNTMLNEEGGIDPLEFRFHAMTDRVGTTGSVWLGLTVQCAQCHTHKFDPIPHADYYRFFGLLNNADEPEFDVPVPDVVARRAEIDHRIAELEAEMPNRFPPPDEFRFEVARPEKVTSANGATTEVLDDGSVRLSGVNPEKDSYSVVIDASADEVAALKVEALTDPALPSTGPGRTPHGNFVLTEFTATVALVDKSADAQPVKFVRATADIAQSGFPIQHAIDGHPNTGWAIDAAKPLNQNRTAIFVRDRPVSFDGRKTRWTIKLDHQFGSQHTLGRFRLSLGQQSGDNGSLVQRRQQHFLAKFNAWLKQAEQSVVRWHVLRPVAAKSNLPLLTVEADDSIFVSGDMSKSDLYELTFRTELRGLTAVRIEALPDDRLPKHGPGRVYYEGPHGDFFLSDIDLLWNSDSQTAPRAVRFARASHTFASGNSNAAAALDDNKQTGWSINGGQGKPHVAVFQLAEPLAARSSALRRSEDAAVKDANPPKGGTTNFTLRMLFERYYAAGIGRFRVSVATDTRPIEASLMSADIEAALLTPHENRSPEQLARLRTHFVSIAPELAGERQAIEQLRQQQPALPTALVFQERTANNPRPTHRHHRGEFLQPKEQVSAGGLSFLPPLPRDLPADRLTMARWLVSSKNPLTARVTVNRHWATFFGRGLVRTQEDFGFQGALPTHPELLDWLAIEFVGQAFQPDSNAASTSSTSNVNRVRLESLTYSLKRLHRLIVTSATYQQSSRVTPELLKRDAPNELLARGPRFRVEAEQIRDVILSQSGLLARKLGGPSVFPPQPASITTEGAYGSLDWKVSVGLDRYRRGLYTFAKRTAPYAMFSTFDAPSGEACVCRREVSNTPLQALTLLNDPVFVEAAQALGRRFAARTDNTESRLRELFRVCLVRPSDADELRRLHEFISTQRQRLVAKELDAKTIAGPGDGDEVERAAWTLVARALLNLDETLTKN